MNNLTEEQMKLPRDNPGKFIVNQGAMPGLTEPSNIGLVEKELEAAKNKHPKFADRMIDERAVKWADSERAIKIRNSHGPFSADDIIMEELAEAMSAYAHGDLAHAKQELAQCAAVCIRGMEWIDAEMKKKEEPK